MKNKLLLGVLIGAVGVALVVLVASAKWGYSRSGATGSGSPSGPHYQMNIIGAPKNMSLTSNDNNGRRIFVPISGSCKIQLAEGDFGVQDHNCLDGTARFQLPAADADNDGGTTYSVWARPLGKPDGTSSTQTCAIDPIDNLEYCSMNTMVQTRTKGKSTFVDVSRDLLYLHYDYDLDGDIDRIPLFDKRLSDYHWNYSNSNLKMLQLRFYRVSSNVN